MSTTSPSRQATGAPSRPGERLAWYRSPYTPQTDRVEALLVETSPKNLTAVIRAIKPSEIDLLLAADRLHRTPAPTRQRNAIARGVEALAATWSQRTDAVEDVVLHLLDADRYPDTAPFAFKLITSVKSPAGVNSLARHPYPAVRNWVATHRLATEESLLLLAADPKTAGSVARSSSPNFTSAVAQALFSSRLPAVRTTALTNALIPAADVIDEIISILEEETPPAVDWLNVKALDKPSCDPEVFRLVDYLLSQDPSTYSPLQNAPLHGVLKRLLTTRKTPLRKGDRPRLTVHYISLIRDNPDGNVATDILLRYRNYPDIPADLPTWESLALDTINYWLDGFSGREAKLPEAAVQTILRCREVPVDALQRAIDVAPSAYNLVSAAFENPVIPAVSILPRVEGPFHFTVALNRFMQPPDEDAYGERHWDTLTEATKRDLDVILPALPRTNAIRKDLARYFSHLAIHNCASTLTYITTHPNVLVRRLFPRDVGLGGNASVVRNLTPEEREQAHALLVTVLANMIDDDDPTVRRLVVAHHAVPFSVAMKGRQDRVAAVRKEAGQRFVEQLQS